LSEGHYVPTIYPKIYDRLLMTDYPETISEYYILESKKEGKNEGRIIGEMNVEIIFKLYYFQSFPYR
jgi:hypothetical protein